MHTRGPLQSWLSVHSTCLHRPRTHFLPSLQSDLCWQPAEPAAPAEDAAGAPEGSESTPPRVAAPITVFKVKKQPYWRIHDEELGWGDRTRSGVTTHLVEGNHQTILRAPYVASLGRALDAHLRKVDAGRQGDGAR